jgi:hypothetical protein
MDGNSNVTGDSGPSEARKRGSGEDPPGSTMTTITSINTTITTAAIITAIAFNGSA